MVGFREIPDEVANERFARSHQGKPDQYAPLLDALAAGKAVEIPLADSKDSRGKRVAIGRRAKQRGMSVEFAADDVALTVRKVAHPPTGTAGATSPKRRGRRAQAASAAESQNT